VAADDLVEVRAADLLFALDDPADVDRQPAVVVERADDGETDSELAFVVGRPAREQLPVALRRLERRRVPQLERVDGLDVVVVVEQQREVALAALLPVDSGCARVGAELLRLEAGAGEHLLDEGGRLVERPPLRGDARLAAEDVERPQRVLLDAFVVGRHPGRL